MTNRVATVLAFLLVGLLSAPASAAGSSPDESGVDEGKTEWKFFSDRGRLFAPLLADPREARVESSFAGVQGGKGIWNLDLGGDLGVAHLVSPAGDTELSMTVRWRVASRFQMFSGSFDLLNTDFSGGVASGYQWGENIFEAYFFHQSSHLGDETIENEKRERIDFSHETFRVLWTRQFGSLRPYAGAQIHVRAKPDDLEGELGIQGGCEYRFEVLEQPCFAAVDAQSRGETGWGLDFSARVGVDLGDSESILRPQHLFLEFYRGRSTMGQYWDEMETTLGIGIAWNF